MKTTSLKVKFTPSTHENGKGRVFFQIIQNRVVRQYNPNIKVSNNEWMNNEEQPYTTDGNVNEDIEVVSRKVEKCIDTLEKQKPNYTSDDVVSMLSTTKYDLVDFIMKLSDRLNKSGKERTSENYSNLARRITEFNKDKNVSLHEIDNDFVEDFEAWLLSTGMKKNTSSYYLRILRAVWNKAIDSGIIPPTIVNPFKHVYTGVDVTKKRAISINDINNIKRINLKAHPGLDFARDMFMFSFYTRGMSFIDMAALKKSDIQNDMISYRRKKTGKMLHINVEKELKKIIDKWTDIQSDYVLPIVKDNKYKDSHKVLHGVNYNLKKVAEYAEVSTALTMYVARHSWATIAQNEANVPLSVISKSLGHSSEQVTQVYLASFGNKAIDEANHNVIKLIK